MKLLTFPALVATVLFCATPAIAQTNARSSPEDRVRFVSITDALEKAPLNATSQADRQWAMQWLTDAPDISVNACLTPLGGLSQKNYSYADEIIAQYMLSMAALIIQHPETASEPDAQQLAGVQGGLNAYRSILKEKPLAKSPALEKLLEMQGRGKLRDFVHSAWVRCSADPSEEVHLP